MTEAEVFANYTPIIVDGEKYYYRKVLEIGLAYEAEYYEIVKGYSIKKRNWLWFGDQGPKITYNVVGEYFGECDAGIFDFIKGGCEYPKSEFQQSLVGLNPFQKFAAEFKNSIHTDGIFSFVWFTFLLGMFSGILVLPIFECWLKLPIVGLCISFFIGAILSVKLHWANSKNF